MARIVIGSAKCEKEPEECKNKLTESCCILQHYLPSEEKLGYQKETVRMLSVISE